MCAYGNTHDGWTVYPTQKRKYRIEFTRETAGRKRHPGGPWVEHPWFTALILFFFIRDKNCFEWNMYLIHPHKIWMLYRIKYKPKTQWFLKHSYCNSITLQYLSPRALFMLQHFSHHVNYLMDNRKVAFQRMVYNLSNK